jgi:hypothetical protein
MVVSSCSAWVPSALIALDPKYVDVLVKRWRIRLASKRLVNLTGRRSPTWRQWSPHDPTQGAVTSVAHRMPFPRMAP